MLNTTETALSSNMSSVVGGVKGNGGTGRIMLLQRPGIIGFPPNPLRLNWVSRNIRSHALLPDS